MTNNLLSILNTTSGAHVTVRPDWFVLTDGTAFAVPSLLEGKDLCDTERVKVFIDHETPCGSEEHAERQKQLIRFACQRGCELANGYGTAYQLMLEKHVKPGNIVAHCGDFGSIYGAAGAYAVRLSAEEMAKAIVSGEVCVSVPRPLHLRVSGSLKAPACAKDAALFALTLLGDTRNSVVLVSGTLPQGSEKIAFFQLLSLGGCEAALEEEGYDAPDAELVLDTVVPTVAGPNDFFCTAPASALSAVPVSAVFIGGCSAGRIEDIRAAAAVIRGRKVRRGVRAMVAFASTDAYIQAANEGLIAKFMDAGVLVMNQGCSACYAHSQGLADTEDVVLSAGSRACPNCMGEGDVTTYLCSAVTAMESAITGVITPAGIEDVP